MKLKINTSIFREYDIRGIAGRDLDAEFAHALGQAYAAFLLSKNPGQSGRAPQVSVGRDCRLTSDDYAASLIRGLREYGLNVIDLGVCPTPLTYFSVFHFDLAGAIMVTGSHNAADYNGFKICLGKDTIHGTQIQEILALMQKIVAEPNVARAEPGTVTQAEIIPLYLDYVLKNALPLKRKKIVLDAGNGTASTVAPPLFKSLGAEVIPLFCELDGNFPNHHPDPTVPENLKALVDKVLAEKADFGLAFDGDSDRLGVVDETGRILYGDELMILFSRSILKAKPGATIISEVKSSYKLYNDISARGGKPIMWKTGHSLIKSKMKETGAALAGEMSGHIFFADRYFGYDDAIYAGLRIYEIACETAAPFSSLLQDLPVTVSTPEIRIECEEDKKFKLVTETKRRISQQVKSQDQIIDIDGVRVDFGDGWGLVRASNTQPVLVLRFEAHTAGRLQEIRTLVEGCLKEAALSVGHSTLDLRGTH